MLVLRTVDIINTAKRALNSTLTSIDNCFRKLSVSCVRYLDEFSVSVVFHVFQYLVFSLAWLPFSVLIVPSSSRPFENKQSVNKPFSRYATWP